jgi:hypothetical protein
MAKVSISFCEALLFYFLNVLFLHRKKKNEKNLSKPASPKGISFGHNPELLSDTVPFTEILLKMPNSLRSDNVIFFTEDFSVCPALQMFRTTPSGNAFISFKSCRFYQWRVD